MRTQADTKTTRLATTIAAGLVLAALVAVPGLVDANHDPHAKVSCSAEKARADAWGSTSRSVHAEFHLGQASSSASDNDGYYSWAEVTGLGSSHGKAEASGNSRNVKAECTLVGAGGGGCIAVDVPSTVTYQGEYNLDATGGLWFVGTREEGGAAAPVAIPAGDGGVIFEPTLSGGTAPSGLIPTRESVIAEFSTGAQDQMAVVSCRVLSVLIG